MYAYLTRVITDKDGTFGVLSFPEKGFSCYTAEPPWKDNKRNVSCIPEGEYEVVLRRSPKYGLIFHVTNVPNRDYILIHAGNFAGEDRTDTHGCILVGSKIGYLLNQRVVLNSRLTLRKLMTMIDKPFKLIIYADRRNSRSDNRTFGKHGNVNKQLQNAEA